MDLIEIPRLAIENPLHPKELVSEGAVRRLSKEDHLIIDADPQEIREFLPDVNRFFRAVADRIRL